MRPEKHFAVGPVRQAVLAHTFEHPRTKSSIFDQLGAYSAGSKARIRYILEDLKAEGLLTLTDGEYLNARTPEGGVPMKINAPL